MTVNTARAGRRSVQVEVEVPGTRDEVWPAVATGDGIASWFVPAPSRGSSAAGEQTLVSVRVHCYGEPAESAARELERAWTPWLAGLFERPDSI